MSLDKAPDREFTSAGIMTRRTSGLGHRPGKKKSCQQKNIYQKSATTETSTAACQKIEVEQKCVEQRKICKNASAWRDNASIPENNDNKDERSKIIADDRDKRVVAYLEHQIQHLKSKANYKASYY